MTKKERIQAKIGTIGEQIKGLEKLYSDYSDMGGNHSIQVKRIMRTVKRRRRRLSRRLKRMTKNYND